MACSAPAAGGRDPLSTDAQPSQLRELFLRYDKDDSGGIEIEELTSIFADVRERTTSKELKKLMMEFGHMGPAGQYQVDFESFCTMMLSLQRKGRLGGAFDFDSHGGMSNQLQLGFHNLTSILARCEQVKRTLRISQMDEAQATEVLGLSKQHRSALGPDHSSDLRPPLLGGYPCGGGGLVGTRGQFDGLGAGR